MNYQVLNREYVEPSTTYILCLCLVSFITQCFSQGRNKVRDDCKMSSMIMEAWAMPAHTKLNGVLHGTSCSLQCVQMHCILPGSQCFLSTELPLRDAIPQNMLWKPCFVWKKGDYCWRGCLQLWIVEPMVTLPGWQFFFSLQGFTHFEWKGAQWLENWFWWGIDFFSPNWWMYRNPGMLQWS